MDSRLSLEPYLDLEFVSKSRSKSWKILLQEFDGNFPFSETYVENFSGSGCRLTFVRGLELTVFVKPDPNKSYLYPPLQLDQFLVGNC